MKWSAQFGPGMEQFRKKDGANSATENLLTANFNTNYVWNFTEKSSFSQNLSVIASKETILTQSDTALTTNIYKHLDVQISYMILHTTNPVDNKHNLNTTLSVNMIYNFA